MSNDITVTIEQAPDINITVGGQQEVDVTIETGLTNPVGFIQFNTAASETATEGRLAWNATDGTLDLGLIGGNVNLQIGQETVIYVMNTTGSTITNGSVVYISGANGNNPLIALADADNTTAHSVIGVTTEDIATGAHGYVTTFGRVRSLNTNAYAPGTQLYLSQTAGQMTSTAPSAPAHRVKVGVVIRQNSQNGVVLVDVQTGMDVADLDDFLLVGTPNNGSFIRYNSSLGVWTNSVYTPDLTTTIQNSYNIRTSSSTGLYGSNGLAVMGDVDGVGNGTLIQVDDDNGTIHLHAAVGGIITDADINTPSVTATTAFTLNGSFNTTIRSVSATYGIQTTDYIVVATANTFTMTLPNATAFTQGKVYILKNRGAGTITVATSASQTIDGSLTQTLTANQRITVASLSGNWVIIG